MEERVNWLNQWKHFRNPLILFSMRIPSASAFISMHHLLNQLMDFYQTCIDTLLGGVEELIRFW